MRESIVGRLVGASVNRLEDRRLLAGAGRYVDDVSVPGMVYAAFLRSPFPHAEIASVDAATARVLPGVHLVLTGDDMKRRTYPFFGVFAFEHLYQPSYWALAVDRVRHVGDPVAIVVADSRRVAEDACAFIDVDYRPLPAVATTAQALDTGRPLVWPKVKSNVLYRASESFGDVRGAFAAADRVIVERFDQHRQSNQPMEPRGIVAEVDPSTGGLIVHCGTQAAHTLKWSVALFTGREPLRHIVRRMVAHKDRTAAIFTGIGDYLKATPALVAAVRGTAPAMVKQLLGNPERALAMSAALTALIGKSPAAIPAVVTGDIGGAFGSKTLVSREYVAVCAAALELGRSVKWVEDRNEQLVCGAQAREESIEVAAAVRDDGEILGMRARMTMNAGAYPGFPFGATLFARMVRTLFPGPYRLPALEFHTRVVASNKSTYGAYRGPWAVETFVRERMLDVIARELGIGRADIRRRNLFHTVELPARMVTGPTLDARMSAAQTLEKAVEVIDFDGWAKVQKAARAEGRHLGLGLATYIEPAPGPPDYLDHFAPGFAPIVNCEPIDAVVEADGTVTIATQQVPHGQGHETTLAQVAAGELSIPVEQVRVCFGDTRRTPFGAIGTGGSRAATFATGATVLASRALRDRIVQVAATLLEAAPQDLVIDAGRIHVQGTPAIAVTLADVTAAAADPLRVRRIFDGGDGGWAASTHACVVELDLDTGQVRIVRYVVIEDCGEIINPAVVAGQIRGGVAQGIGATLYENATYDDDGQFQSGTFMDYLLPTAMEIPDIEIHHLETSSDVFANYRGVGEGGMIGSPAALTNAIEDALADLDVRITEQHLPPTRILELAGVLPRRDDDKRHHR